MKPEQLEVEADRMMRFARNLVAKREQFHPMISMYAPKTGWDVLDLTSLFCGMDASGPTLDHERKKVIYSVLRSIIEIGGFTGCCIGTDAFGMRISSEKLKEHGFDIATAMKYSTKQMQEMGLGDRLDTLMVTAQSRDYVVHLQQPYRPAPDSVEFLEARKESGPRDMKRGGVHVFEGWIMHLMKPE